MGTRTSLATTDAYRPSRSARQRSDEPNGIDTNGCANESDESRNHEGMPNMCTHAITPASTGKPHKGETDSVGSHVDALNWRTDILNIETHAERTIEAVKQHSDSPNGARDHTDGSSVRMDMHNAGRGVRQTPDKPSDYRNHPDKSGKRTDGHSVANDVRTPANKAEMIRTCVGNAKLTENARKRDAQIHLSMENSQRRHYQHIHTVNRASCGPNSKLRLWTSRERRRGDCTKFWGWNGRNTPERRSHTETLQSISTESTVPGVDAAASRSDL